MNGDNNLAASRRPQDTTLHVYYNDLSYPPAVREMSAVDRVYSMLSTPFATRGSHALLAINGVQPQTRDKRSRASSSVQSAFSWMCAVLFVIAMAFTLFLGFRSSCIVMLTDAQRKDVELQPGIVENQGPDSGASKADVSTADTSAELWFGLDERWYVTIVAAGSAMVLDLYLNLVMTFLPIENRARGVSSAVTGLVFSLGTLLILTPSRLLSPPNISHLSTSLDPPPLCRPRRHRRRLQRHPKAHVRPLAALSPPPLHLVRRNGRSWHGDARLRAERRALHSTPMHRQESFWASRRASQRRSSRPYLSGASTRASSRSQSPS